MDGQRGAEEKRIQDKLRRKQQQDAVRQIYSDLFMPIDGLYYRFQYERILSDNIWIRFPILSKEDSEGQTIEQRVENEDSTIIFGHKITLHFARIDDPLNVERGARWVYNNQKKYLIEAKKRIFCEEYIVQNNLPPSLDITAFSCMSQNTSSIFFCFEYNKAIYMGTIYLPINEIERWLKIGWEMIRTLYVTGGINNHV